MQKCQPCYFGHQNRDNTDNCIKHLFTIDCVFNPKNAYLKNDSVNRPTNSGKCKHHDDNTAKNIINEAQSVASRTFRGKVLTLKSINASMFESIFLIISFVFFHKNNCFSSSVISCFWEKKKKVIQEKKVWDV